MKREDEKPRCEFQTKSIIKTELNVTGKPVLWTLTSYSTVDPFSMNVADGVSPNNSALRAILAPFAVAVLSLMILPIFPIDSVLLFLLHGLLFDDRFSNYFHFYFYSSTTSTFSLPF